MDAKYIALLLCASLTAACAHGQAGSRTAVGEEACAREPGEPPQVGEGAQTASQQPCASSHSVMGESAKRPEEL